MRCWRRDGTWKTKVMCETCREGNTFLKVFIFIKFMRSYIFKRNKDDTLLYCLLWTFKSFSLLSPLQTKIIYCLSISISVPSYQPSCNTVCVSDHLSLHLSLSCCLIPAQTGKQASASTCLHNARFFTTEVVRARCMGAWFCIHSVYCAPPAPPTSFIICVCWSACLSSSLPHTFADVFPDANIMPPAAPGASHTQVSPYITQRLLTFSNSLSGVWWMFKYDGSEIALVRKAFLRAKICFGREKSTVFLGMGPMCLCVDECLICIHACLKRSSLTKLWLRRAEPENSWLHFLPALA